MFGTFLRYLFGKFGDGFGEVRGACLDMFGGYSGSCLGGFREFVGDNALFKESIRCSYVLCKLVTTAFFTQPYCSLT